MLVSNVRTHSLVEIENTRLSKKRSDDVSIRPPAVRRVDKRIY
jgi:hypothetical protein